MKKKADLAWEQITKVLIVIVILIVLLLIIGLFKDKMYELFERLKIFIRFGG